MVKSAKDRIEKYKANIDPEITVKFLRSQKESMIKKESKYFIEITAIEGKIKGLLQKEGVLPFQIPNYLFFGRELYKFTTKYPLETALSQANIMAYKWYVKGLKESLLKKIGNLFRLPLDFVPIVTLTGNAEPEDVILNKTFYNTDPKNKLSGILELTGNAQPLDVYEGLTFYNTDPKTKLTGTLPKPPVPPESAIFGNDTPYSTIAFNISNAWRFISSFPLWSGIGNKIYAYLRSYPNPSNPKVKTALYETFDHSKFAESEEKTLNLTTSYEWYPFDLPSLPDLIKNRCYDLAIWSQLIASTETNIGAITGTTNSHYFRTVTYTSWASFLTTFSFSTAKLALYCLYTPTS